MTSPDSKPPDEWLQHLHLAAQWERLETVAGERLAGDPSDEKAHFHRAWALLKLERTQEMRPHVEFLLRINAEDAEYLKLAALCHINGKRRLKQARQCLDAALKIAPEDAWLWYLASVVEFKRYRVEHARQLIQRARQLDPDDANIASLHITLHTMEQTGARAAWNAVEEHEQALALDPENESLIASMGDVFLNELEMPERAEALYRRALSIDPANQRHQKRLWRAMQARSLLFRTLRLPISGMTLAVNALRGLRLKPWLALFFILGFKFILIYLAWLSVATVVFAPPALMAGWLVMADLQRASRTADKVGRWWLGFHRLPFAARLTCCLVLMAAFWWGLFALLGVPVGTGFISIGAFFLLHLGAMVIRVSLRKRAAQKTAAALPCPPPPARFTTGMQPSSPAPAS